MNAGGPRIIETIKIPLYVHDLGAVMKGAGGPIIIANTMISLYVHGLSGMVKGAGGPRISKHTKISLHFLNGRRGEWRVRSHNH